MRVKRYLKKYSLSLLLLSILIALVSMLLMQSAQFGNFHQADIEDGFIDFTEYDFDENIPYLLNGEWRFYWSEFIEYDQIINGNAENYSTMYAPGKWNGEVKKDITIPNEGYATYVLNVKLNPESDSILALKLMEMYNSYELYWNDRLISQNGTIGISKAETTPNYVPSEILLQVEQEDNYLILHVSNFESVYGGAWGDIHIGNYKDIYQLVTTQKSLALFYFGTIIILAFYHLVIFLLRREDIYSLLLGLFCLSISIRPLMVGERIINQMLPNISWHTKNILEYSTVYLSFMLLGMFLYELYKDVFLLTALRIIQIVSSVFMLMVIMAPSNVYTTSIFYYELFLIAASIYLVYVVIIAIIKGNISAVYTLIGTSVLILAAVNDILYTNTIINTVHLVPSAMLFFVFTQAIVLAIRHNDSYNRSSRLAEVNNLMNIELKELNESLEAKIQNRTVALQEKNEILDSLSKTDGLTKLYNHKYIINRLDDEIKISFNQNTPLSVAMFDLDHFKNINDNFGHQVGDEVLVKVSECIKEKIRDSDIIGRYGGEEFLLILPGLTIDGAYKVVERIRLSIEKLEFSQINLKVTLSGGLVICSKEITNSSQLIHSADKLLYKAKEQGRNRILS